MSSEASNNKAEWINPFSVDRVEDWRVEEHPENYMKIVSLFAPPDFMSKLEDPEITKAIFIMGGRGCGKSHILKRMSVQSEVMALDSKLQRKLQFTDYSQKYYGTYIKSDCFSPLSRESLKYFDENQLDVLFEHLFNLEVIKTFIDSISFTSNYFDYDLRSKEASICNTLCKVHGYSEAHSFDEFIALLDLKVNEIINITKKILFDKNFEKHIENVIFTKSPDFIIKSYEVLSKEYPLLEGKPLFLLLDEYESLDENQQKLINQIIKSRRITLRTAVKTRGIKTLSTRTSEKLDEFHDYDAINLHFKIDKRISAYRNLTKTIFQNRLNQAEGLPYKEKDPRTLLPAPLLADEGISEDDLKKELLSIKSSLKKVTSIRDKEKYWKNFKGHYKEAAIYRILKKKGKDKLYAGFNEYVSLSSGIIRLFIWLCREAFDIAYKDKIDIQEGESINVRIQANAAKNVARSELNITIPQNVNNRYSSQLAYLINDLGQVLRARLYYSTQPQANRFEIVDPEKLDLQEYDLPRNIIESGYDLPVFLTETSFKPRDVKYPFPKTFTLNRIFSPLLRVPTEGRWRTEIKSDELKGLCLSEHRDKVLQEIVNQIKGRRRKIRTNSKVQTKLGSRKDEMTFDIFSEIDRPIALENCPVTDSGCNMNLIEHKKATGESLHSFLAIPFNEGWVSDPRDWIKEGLSECCSVVCKDIGDFPSIGYFLCQICSCVRQYQFGLYEITEANPNVVFELGMAVGLNKPGFLLVYKKKIPNGTEFPPPPLEGIKYIPYELTSGSVIKVLTDNVKPIIERPPNNKNSCTIINAECSHMNIKQTDKMVLVCLPDSDPFFNEVFPIIEKEVRGQGYSCKLNKPAKSVSELCQLCRGIREASFIIADTTSNNLSTIFALGVSFGRDKKFIQLHNKELSPERPISDLKQWSIEYRNLRDLENELEKEVPSRLNS
jgi:hypothetical protein